MAVRNSTYTPKYQLLFLSFLLCSLAYQSSAATGDSAKYFFGIGQVSTMNKTLRITDRVIASDFKTVMVPGAGLRLAFGYEKSHTAFQLGIGSSVVPFGYNDGDDGSHILYTQVSYDLYSYDFWFNWERKFWEKNKSCLYFLFSLRYKWYLNYPYSIIKSVTHTTLSYDDEGNEIYENKDIFDLYIFNLPEPINGWNASIGFTYKLGIRQRFFFSAFYNFSQPIGIGHYTYPQVSQEPSGFVKVQDRGLGISFGIDFPIIVKRKPQKTPSFKKY